MTDVDINSITGRDEHLLSLALAWAVAAIQQLPQHERSVDDPDVIRDMRAILDERIGKDNAERAVIAKRLKLSGARSGGETAV